MTGIPTATAKTSTLFLTFATYAPEHATIRKRINALQSFHRIVASHFRPRRHLLSAPVYHQLLRTRFVEWRELTGVAAP